MPNLKDIKSRIGSVQNTKKITKAMKMVAAAKVKKAENTVKASRPFSDELLHLFRKMLGTVGEISLNGLTVERGIENFPAFIPVVGDFYSGMEVTIPLFANQLNNGFSVNDIKEVYKNKYNGPIVSYVEDFDEGGFVSANRLEMKDSMEISVSGNEERILLIARYDNLGKGASGSAVECMNIVLGADKTEGLEI